jgi:hypothetical protein
MVAYLLDRLLCRIDLGTLDPVGIEETCPFGKMQTALLHVWIACPWHLPKVSVNARKLMETRSPYVRPGYDIFI